MSGVDLAPNFGHSRCMDTSWIDAVTGERDIATERDIEAIARHVYLEPAQVTDFADLVRRICDQDESRNEFDLRAGEWQIDLSKLTIRGALTSALVAALLDLDGLVKTSISALALVLPSIVEIDRITLSSGDELLLAEVRLTHAAGRGFVTVDALYDELPDDVQSTLNRFDFADTIERIRAAGHIEGGVVEGHVLVVDPDQRKRVSFS